MLQHELKKVAQENPDRHGATWNLGFVERRTSGMAVAAAALATRALLDLAGDRLQGSSLRVLLISHWIAAIPGSIVRCHRGSEAWFGLALLGRSLPRPQTAQEQTSSCQGSTSTYQGSSHRLPLLCGAH
jgi:hypothetical protein